MTDDEFERRLRAALDDRAATVRPHLSGPELRRRAAARNRPGERVRRAAPVLASAAAVVAVAASVALVTRGGDDPAPAPIQPGGGRIGSSVPVLPPSSSPPPATPSIAPGPGRPSSSPSGSAVLPSTLPPRATVPNGPRIRTRPVVPSRSLSLSGTVGRPASSPDRRTSSSGSSASPR